MNWWVVLAVVVVFLALYALNERSKGGSSESLADEDDPTGDWDR